MDKKYKIKISYETGNSFGHHSEVNFIELQWDNLDIAKENLQRISEHYRWYQDKNSNSWRHVPSIERPSFVNKKYDQSLNLLTDERKEHNYCTFWCGYFETLYSAEITEDNSDRKINFY